MIGLVLSGGKSTRMGTDKGLLEQDGLSWSKLAYDKLRAQMANVYISVSEQQKEVYTQHFNNDVLLYDDNSIPVGGPLLGLLSAHLKHRSEDIMVLACDMVKMEQEPISYLFQQFRDIPGMEAYLYFNEHGIQPLMAIYHHSLLKKVCQKAISGSLEKFSMKHMVDISQCFKVAVPTIWATYFVNFNTHEDLQNFIQAQQ